MFVILIHERVEIIFKCKKIENMDMVHVTINQESKTIRIDSAVWNKMFHYQNFQRYENSIEIVTVQGEKVVLEMPKGRTAILIFGE